MGPEFRSRVDSLLERVLSRPPFEREELLHNACGEDQDLLREVSSLLRCHERARTFLEAPSALARGIEEALGWGEPTFEIGQLVEERFEIVRLLDRGGMGEVYEALDRDLKERVALKTIRPELALDGKSVERFHEEVRLARRITHRNVCRIHDVFHASGQAAGEVLFLTMELLEGESLARRLARERRIAWREAVPILAHILEALEEARSEGIVHRDLKSENVMLVLEEGRVRAVVTDFGLASLTDNAEASPASESPISARASSRLAWGTPAYMSPEQLRGESLDHRSDLFSFGVIGYEVLTGEPPYPMSTGRTLLERFRVEPRIPREIEPTIPRALQRVVQDCLSVDPSHRPETAARVLDRIEAIPTKTPARRVALATALSAVGGVVLAVKGGPGVIDFVARWAMGPRVLPLEDYVDSPEALIALREGLDKIREGANLKAIPLFKKAVREDPGSLVAKVLLVQALLNVGEQKAANELNESLLVSMNKLGDASVRIFARAVLARTDAKYAEASDILRSLVSRYPDDLVLLVSCARTVEETGDMPRALELYERAANSSSAAAVLGAARCLASTGELGKAMKLLSDVLESGQLGTDPEVLGMAHSIRGFAFRDRGDLDDARSSFEEALNYRRQAGDRRGQVASMSHLGMVYRSTGRAKESIAVLLEALEIARTMGDDCYESHALYTLGQSYDLEGLDEQALACARQSLEIELRRGDHVEIPVRLSFLANVHRRRGRYGEAEVLLDQAREHTSRSGDRLIEATRLWVGASIETEQGRYEEAIERLKSLLSICEGFQEPSLAEAKVALAGVHDRRGEYGIADRIGLEALDLTRERRIRRESAFTSHWRSQHLAALGDFQSARSSLEEARSVAKELHLREMLLDIDSLNATIHRCEGSFDVAAMHFRSCLERAERSGFAHIAVRSRVDLARVLVRLKDCDEAAELLADARAEAARCEMLPMHATCQLAFAELRLFKDDCGAALTEAKVAADLALSFGGRPLVRAANALLGEAHARRGDEKEAERCFDVARSVHQQIVSGVPSQFASSYGRHPETVETLRRMDVSFPRA